MNAKVLQMTITPESEMYPEILIWRDPQMPSTK